MLSFRININIMSSEMNLKLNLNPKLANGWHIPYATYEFSQGEHSHRIGEDQQLYTILIALLWGCSVFHTVQYSLHKQGKKAGPALCHLGGEGVLYVLVYGLCCCFINDVAALFVTFWGDDACVGFILQPIVPHQRQGIGTSSNSEGGAKYLLELNYDPVNGGLG